MYLNLKTWPCLSKREELLGLTLSSVSTLDRLWKWLKPAQLLIKTVDRVIERVPTRPALHSITSLRTCKEPFTHTFLCVS